MYKRHFSTLFVWNTVVITDVYVQRHSCSMASVMARNEQHQWKQLFLCLVLSRDRLT